MSLNQRHKTGLFLVLVATGLGLLFEASAKQTAGLVLLGVAATWFLGSLSLRVLGFVSCSLACVIGLCLAVVPILDARYSYLAKSASYDSALVKIRAAVAEADVWEIDPRPPRGFVLEAPELDLKQSQEKLTVSEFAARLKRKYPEYSDLNDDELVRGVIAKYPVFRKAVQVDWKEVKFPDGARDWLRPDSIITRWATALAREEVTVPFPSEATDDSIMDEFRAKHLLPRPTFSVAASIVANRGIVFTGVVLFALGLLGFSGMLWRVRRRSVGNTRN